MTIILSQDSGWSTRFCKDCGRQRPCRFHQCDRYYCESHAKAMLRSGTAQFEKPKPVFDKVATCLVCNKDFELRGRSRRRTCSEKCFSELVSQNSPAIKPRLTEIIPSNCPVCGVEFTPPKYRQKRRTCGKPECFSVYQSERVSLALVGKKRGAAKPKIYDKLCLVCGTQFTPASDTDPRQSCSRDCAEILRIQAYRETCKARKKAQMGKPKSTIKIL